MLGVLAAPWLVYLLAGGFARTPGKVELTADMIRIVFPYILFVSLVSLAGGVLNVYRRFAIPAFTPVLLNLSIIGAALFLARYFDPPIIALAWGVFIGGIAQLAFQIAPLARLGMLPRPRFDWRDEGVRRVLLADGARGDRRVGRADLRAHQHAARRAAGRRPHLVDHLRRPADGIPERAARRRARHGAAAVARASTTATPTTPSTRRCSTGACGSRSCSRCRRRSRLWLLALPLVSTLYQYGQFGVNDVWQTRAALLGYSVGLLGLILVKILAPGFYARQHMKTPVKIAFVTVLVTQTLAVLLMWPLGHAGLTLATSLGACVNAALLFWFLRRQRLLRAAAGLVRCSCAEARGRAGRAGRGAVLRWPARREAWLAAGLWAKVGRLLGLIVAGGAAVYFGALFAAGLPAAGLQPERRPI